MNWLRDDFPVQDRLIYEILVQDGKFVLNSYDRYETHVACGSRESYRIWSQSGIRTLNYDRLDRVSHGRLYTFDPDLQRAAALFQKRAEEDIRKAEEMSRSAREFQQEVQAASAALLST